MPTLQQLVVDAERRLREQAEARSERYFRRPFEEAHGIANGTIKQIVEGKRRSVDAKTGQKLAKALGLPFETVMSAAGSTDAADAADAPPAPPRHPMPPVETVEPPRVYNDDIEWLILQATDKARHEHTDLNAVRAFAAKRGTLLRKDQDMVGLFVRWLDVAAALRRAGEPATFSAMIDALTLSSLRHEHIDSEGMSELDHLGAELYRQQTGRDEPPPWPAAERSPRPPPSAPPAKALTPEPPNPRRPAR